MNTVLQLRQQGLSFGGFILGAFLLVFASLTFFKFIPAYIQNAKINSTFSTIANDPEMQKASPREIRMSFEKRASIDEISVITSNEIDIASGDGVLELSASYTATIPLFANISILLEFNPSSN